MFIPDYESEFEIVGKLAKYFKGGMTVEYMMGLTFREVFRWYKRYEKQMAEESIIEKYVREKKPIPTGIAFINLVNKKIKEWNGEDNK